MNILKREQERRNKMKILLNKTERRVYGYILDMLMDNPEGIVPYNAFGFDLNIREYIPKLEKKGFIVCKEMYEDSAYIVNPRYKKF